MFIAHSLSSDCASISCSCLLFSWGLNSGSPGWNFLSSWSSKAKSRLGFFDSAHSFAALIAFCLSYTSVKSEVE